MMVLAVKMLPLLQLKTLNVAVYLQKIYSLIGNVTSLLGGAKGEISYLPLFGLKHSQLYATSPPI